MSPLKIMGGSKIPLPPGSNEYGRRVVGLANIRPALQPAHLPLVPPLRAPDGRRGRRGQDVFRAVLAAIGQFQREGDGSFRGWLRVITRNKVRDFLWDRTHAPGSGGDTGQLLDSIAADPQIGDGPDPEEERILYSRALDLVLAEHKEETRTAFLRVVIDKQDPAAVAADLGMTVNAVYLIKSRVLRRLREEYTDLLEPRPE